MSEKAIVSNEWLADVFKAGRVPELNCIQDIMASFSEPWRSAHSLKYVTGLMDRVNLLFKVAGEEVPSWTMDFCWLVKAWYRPCCLLNVATVWGEKAVFFARDKSSHLNEGDTAFLMAALSIVLILHSDEEDIDMEEVERYLSIPSIARCVDSVLASFAKPWSEFREDREEELLESISFCLYAKSIESNDPVIAQSSSRIYLLETLSKTISRRNGKFFFSKEASAMWEDSALANFNKEFEAIRSI